MVAAAQADTVYIIMFVTAVSVSTARTVSKFFELANEFVELHSPLHGIGMIGPALLNQLLQPASPARGAGTGGGGGGGGHGAGHGQGHGQ
jgi:hypothetical protein